MSGQKQKINPAGFTIVELLIVIVVIGILAAIVVVSFNGIQQGAKVAALKADAHSAATKLELANTTDDEYTYSFNETFAKDKTKETVYEYARSNNNKSFCLEVSNALTDVSTFTVASGKLSPQEGRCETGTVGDVYTSDFTSSVDGWTPISSDDFDNEYSLGNAQLATSTAIRYQSKTSLRLTYDSNVKYGLVGKTITGLTPGDTYVVRLKVYVPSGQDPNVASGLLFVGDTAPGTNPGSYWVEYAGGSVYTPENLDRWEAIRTVVVPTSSSMGIYIGMEAFNNLSAPSAVIYYSDITVTHAV